MPKSMPVAAGTNASRPIPAAISIDGIKSDQTDAATMTPDAKPSSPFCSSSLSLSFRKNYTCRAERRPGKRNHQSPKNLSCFLPFLRTLLLFLTIECSQSMHFIFFSFLIFHSGFLQFFQCFGELLRNHARVAAQHIAFCEILQERGQLRTL